MSPQVVALLEELVRRRNRELAGDAALKAFLGMVFTLVTYAVVFWMSWFVAVLLARSLNLAAWQFAAILVGLFLAVAIRSAWKRVDPMVGLKPLSERQLMLTLLSQAAPNFLYFSPRHASAGAALILLGGPANVFEALGIWAHRLPSEKTLIEEAARLLAACASECPAEQVRHANAAVLLRRLSLIKIIPRADSAALTVTEKGAAVLAGGKKKRAKTSKAKQQDDAPDEV